MLVMLLMACVPSIAALAQEASELPGGLEDDEILIGPGQAIGCDSVFASEPEPEGLEEISSPVGTLPEVEAELRQFCLENGYVLRSEAVPTGSGTIQYANQ